MSVAINLVVTVASVSMKSMAIHAYVLLGIPEEIVKQVRYTDNKSLIVVS